MLLRSCRTYITCMVALCAVTSSTVLVLFAGIAAACGGTGGGGGCPAPSVSTGGYDSLTSSSVTLTGSVNPQGCQTYYAFEYGRSSEGYPDEIVSSAGSGTSSVPVSTSSAIVQPSTSYHYRLSAWNSGGEVTGGSGSFTTPAACPAPTVTTDAASAITANTARLNGRVNPNGCSTEYTFEYGLAASGTYTKLTGSAGSGTGPVSVWKDVSGLQVGKMYTFRLSAKNSKGNTDGSWLYFSTVGGPDPVLFIHGYKPDVGGWNPMISSFQQSGWPASSLFDWYYDWSLSNVTTANAIAAKVNHILSTTGKTRVDLISHSMGSLSARYYVKNLGGGAKVDDFVSLGGLNHGTSSFKLSLPYIGCSATPTPCNEMVENSPFLTALNASDETPGPVWYMTIVADCDPVVSSSSVALAGATNEVWDAPLASCVDPTNSSHSILRSESTVIGKVKAFVK
jgi:triacylglycerol lipase